jgi:dethiobiotin synthetase
MLKRVAIPGLFITGTDTEVGKTVVAGAIADSFRRRGKTVAVCKPCATGCVHRREGWVSEDAEFLAHCADTRHPLDLVCPQRYAEALAPAVAAERAGTPLDWSAIDRAIATMTQGADVLIVEGVGGVAVPMDAKHTVADMMAWLGLPAVIVAKAGLGTINHTLLTAWALRQRNVAIAGVVMNRYPAETPGLAEETNPRAIEKWGKLPILCFVPDSSAGIGRTIPPEIIAAIGAVDWSAKAEGE